jgi:transposase
MLKVSTIGLDLAKHVFQVHGIDESGAVVIRRRLRRSDVMSFFARVEPTIVGMEACSTSHHWARELSTLGHQVRLMPAQYVKAYVKRQKNDAADAEAICEAVMRPSMRFVPIKTAEQQAALMLHRSRDLLVRQRTMLINSLRGHLAEFGIIEARGPDKVVRLVALLEDAEAPVPGRWPGKPCAPWRPNSRRSRFRSQRSRLQSWPGTGRTKRASVSRPSPASAR